MLIDNNLLLLDRIQKIQSFNTQGDLESNAYLSFSGGKDSTVLHYLIDLALPNNSIPRVFINTGIEYKMIVDFVKEIAKNDDRFLIIEPTKNIKETLENYGYPFKSKQHSHNVELYQHNVELIENYKSDIRDIQYYIDIPRKARSVIKYIYGMRLKNNSIYEASRFLCPKKLQYQFTKDLVLKISDKCCSKLKKEPVGIWEKENNKNICITGMRKGEGGNRNNLGCIQKRLNTTLFHPLSIIDDKWEDWFIDKYKIKLCDLYYPPYNFKRTGCKGCPFSLDLQKQLTIMETYLPNERKQCEKIWKPIYDEYRRIGYRLNRNEQLKLF